MMILLESPKFSFGEISGSGCMASFTAFANGRGFVFEDNYQSYHDKFNDTT